MEGNIITEVFPVLSGVIIAPFVTWLEKVLPTNAPVRAPLFALVLAGLLLWGLSWWLAPELTKEELIRYVLTSVTFTWLAKSTKK